MGLACSECFSGRNLQKLLQPGLEYEIQVMQNLLNEELAAPLSIHTSAGVPEPLSGFLAALEPHLPWKNEKLDDWVCSSQLEGASAVWAGIDMLLQVAMIESGNKERIKVAVGSTSYHGPPSTSFGAGVPLWTKHYQIKYPTPVAGEEMNEEDLLSQYKEFLNNHADEVGVILFEPQWGSSQAGLPWSIELLKKYIELAKERGIKILCDEIMCGLGRHGHGTLFVSEAWDLQPDAVTFGKAIGGGCYPLSGAVLKTGRKLLAANGATVMQSHTYAGSSTRALMTATEVLQELPNWFASVSKLGEEMGHILRYIQKVSDGMVICHGQGLMWGGIFSRKGQCKNADFRANLVKAFKKHCDELGLLPYHVPLGGFMLSPVLDVDVGTIYKLGELLEQAIIRTRDEVGWTQSNDSESETASIASSSSSLDVEKLAQEIYAQEVSKCVPHLHATKACTSCASFVSPAIRTRFLNV